MPTVACSAHQAGDEIVCSYVSLSLGLFGFCPHLFCVLHEMIFFFLDSINHRSAIRTYMYSSVMYQTGSIYVC